MTMASPATAVRSSGSLSSGSLSPIASRVQTIGIVVAALMVWAGQVKQIPPLSSLPVDFTLAMTGLALVAGVVFSFLSRSSIQRDPLLVVGLLLCCGVFGAVNYVSSDYAVDKTLRFFLLTWPSTAAVAMLIRDHHDTKRYIRAVLVVSLGLSFFIYFGGEREYDDTLGRLTTPLGDTILFGQACGAVAIAIAAWVLTSDRVTLGRLIAAGGLFAFEIWTLLAIGSKGPIQALALGSVVIMALQLRRMSPGTAGRVVGIVIAGVVALAFVWSSVPLWSRQRILQFASGNSAGSRFQAWNFTWSNLSGSPFGNGWGSWDLDSPIPIVYPHNLVLEVWYEAGLLGLAAILVMIVVAVVRSLALYDVDRDLATMVLALVSFWVFAAQVSSDVNGNKLLFGMLVAAAAPIAWSRVERADRIDEARGEPPPAAVTSGRSTSW